MCRPAPAPKRCSASAAALASFSIAAGTPKRSARQSRRSTSGERDVHEADRAARALVDRRRNCRRRSRRPVVATTPRWPRARRGAAPRASRSATLGGRRRRPVDHAGEQLRPAEIDGDDAEAAIAPGYDNPSPWPRKTSHTASIGAVGPRADPHERPAQGPPARARTAGAHRSPQGPKREETALAGDRRILLASSSSSSCSSGRCSATWRSEAASRRRTSGSTRGRRRALTPQDGSLLSNPSTILVLGADRRAGRGPRAAPTPWSSSGPTRTSTGWRCLSIPRDLRVEIPATGPQKINAAYAFGGPTSRSRRSSRSRASRQPPSLRRLLHFRRGHRRAGRHHGRRAPQDPLEQVRVP